MFSNVGAKIQGLAKFFAYAGMAISILVAIMIMGGASIISSGLSEYGLLSGLLFGCIGCFVSWAGSLALYGFGELVENVSTIAHNSYVIASKDDSSDMQGDK